MSACVATTFLGTLQFNRATISSRQHLVEAVSTFLPMVTWFDSTFSSRLNFRPKTWALANCSLPLSFSPSDLGRDPEERMRFISWTSSSTLSGVLEIKHKESPDCFRSSWTPNTLQIESKGRSLWVDAFHPSRENTELAQNSTCLDSLALERHRKSSKYADHIRLRRTRLHVWLFETKAHQTDS